MLNEDTIKIHKKMLFTDGDLINYLKTVKKFSKLEEEILATLTYKKAYEKLRQVATLVGFPCKENKEIEINKRPLLLANTIGSFIKKCSEEKSLIDSILVDPQDNKHAKIRPLQIKFLGKGKYKNVTDEKFIKFLKSYQDNQQNKISLIIVLDGPHNLQLKNIVDWLKDNYFPFQEVIFIYVNNKSGIMEFFQLKPSRETFCSIKMKRQEIIGRI